MRVPWTARRSNQSILKEISPKDYIEGKNSNTVATSYKELSLEKTLMLGRIGGRSRRG